MAQHCRYCGQTYDWLDDELRNSHCTGSKYGTHKWETVEDFERPRRTGGAGARTQPLTDDEYRREMEKLADLARGE